MDKAYESSLRKHLHVSVRTADQIIEELNDHLNAYAHDHELQGCSAPTSTFDVLGCPKELAKECNASHIPCYRLLYSDALLSCCILSIFILIRAICVQGGMAFGQIIDQGLMYFELAAVFFHIGFLAYAIEQRLHMDAWLRGWKLLLLVCIVQGSILLYLMQTLTGVFFFLQLLKVCIYCGIVTFYVPILRSWIRRRWITVFSRY